jgi:hypothetical protein
MSEAAVVRELAVAVVLEVFANLSFVVAVEGANYFWSREVIWHGIIHVSLLSKTMRERAHFAKGTGASQLKMSAQRRFVLLPICLVLFVVVILMVALLWCGIRLRFTFLLLVDLSWWILLSWLLTRNRINEHSWRVMLREELGSRTRRKMLRECRVCHKRHNRD